MTAICNNRTVHKNRTATQTEEGTPANSPTRTKRHVQRKTSTACAAQHHTVPINNGRHKRARANRQTCNRRMGVCVHGGRAQRNELKHTTQKQNKRKQDRLKTDGDTQEIVATQPINRKYKTRTTPHETTAKTKRCTMAKKRRRGACAARTAR